MTNSSKEEEEKRNRDQKELRADAERRVLLIEVD